MPLTHNGSDTEVYQPFSARASLSVMREPEAPRPPDPDAGLPVLPDDHHARKAVVDALEALNEAIEQGHAGTIERMQNRLDSALALERRARVHLQRVQEQQKITDTRKRIEIDNKRKADALRMEHTMREAVKAVTLRFNTCGVEVEIFPSRVADMMREEMKLVNDVLVIIQRETMLAIGANRVLAKGDVPRAVPRTGDQMEAEIRDVCRRGITRGYVEVRRA